MPKHTSSPPQHWQSFDYRGRCFFDIVVPVHNDREVRLTVAQKIADRYEVQDVLTRGGGGVILVAKDLHTGSPVLVKAFLEYNTERDDLSEPLKGVIESLRRSRHHLQTERRILVQLHNIGCNAVPHPNDYVFDANPALEGPHKTDAGETWQFDDFALITSEPYLVMQYVPGKSLQDLLEKQYSQGFEEPVALAIIDQVARVIELVEQPLKLSNGQTWELVYQDLKPGNILVDRSGQTTVLDFGGCQLIIDNMLVLNGSHSPGYCAPECGKWDEAITPAADCYGLGSTLYHMLSGFNPRRQLPKKRPSHGPQAVHISTKPLALQCSPEVVELVSRCVAWEPEARFQNTAEFRAALAPLLQPE